MGRTSSNGSRQSTGISRRAFSTGALAMGAAAGLGPALSTAAQDSAVATPVTYGGTQSMPVTDEPVTFRVLCVSNPQVEDFTTNTFTAWYEEQTHVHLEWEVVPEQEALTSLNVRLASGDYPDIIMDFDVDPALQLLYGSQGVFLPLEGYLDELAVGFKQVENTYPLARQVITAPDGSVYSLPHVNDCFHCKSPSKLWIYQPWLDALGLDVPTTIDEFADVLRAFKEGDPNGNGQADEIPLISATSAAQPLDHFFMNSFIFDPGGKRLTLKDNSVTAVYTTEEWRQGVMYLAGLYAEGLIGPETFTQDRDQLRLLTNTPDDVVVGSVPALAPSAFMDIDSLEGGRWTDYVTIPPLAGPDGVQLAYHNPYQPFTTGNFVITSACENPEVAFKWADGLYGLEATLRTNFGVPDEDWRWAEPGETGIDGSPALWKRLSPFGQAQNYCWRQTGPSFRSNEFRLREVIDPATANSNLEAILYKATNENYIEYSQPDEWVVPPLYFTQEQAQQVAELDASISTYVDESFALAVTGQLNLDTDWETYLATLDGMGLAQYIQIHQDAYDSTR